MRISKKYVKETMQELWTVTVECPYCEIVRPYRSLVCTSFNVRCKSCKKEFIVEHELDDVDMIEIGYKVLVEVNGEIVKGTIDSDTYDTEDINDYDMLVWVKLDSGERIEYSAYDLKIDRVANKELWQKYS